MLFKRLAAFGHAPLCSLRPERAPRVLGFTCPLCYRCLGAVCGVLVMRSLSPPLSAEMQWLASCSGLLCAADVMLDWLQLSPSTNIRRFWTGVPLGLAVSGVFLLVGESTWKYLQSF